MFSKSIGPFSITEHRRKRNPLMSVWCSFICFLIPDLKQIWSWKNLSWVLSSHRSLELYPPWKLWLCAPRLSLGRLRWSWTGSFQFRHFNKHLECNSLPPVSRKTPLLCSFEAISPSIVRHGSCVLPRWLDCIQFRQPLSLSHWLIKFVKWELSPLMH